MQNILSYNTFYFVGIKGVAMTSLAQCLLDAGKKIQGSDVKENFVTENILKKIDVVIDEDFDGEIPADIECVIYTSAHHAQENPQVIAAKQKNLPVFSQAEALASLFNQRKGIAVCGVGGKSTTSAMIAWILEKVGKEPSFSVGVGNIPGLDKTGQWQPNSEYFISEADEYVIDPGAAKRGEEITPRFSFLQPTGIVCTQIAFDHPDVYRDFNHTLQTYKTFFKKLPANGWLIANEKNKLDVDAMALPNTMYFGKTEDATYRLQTYEAHQGEVHATFTDKEQKTYRLRLQIPGEYNVMNAIAAVAACFHMGISIDESIDTLFSFRSTMRRAEYIGEKRGVRFYDDYAHHPNEVQAVIHAFREWFPQQKLIVAFQSHTFSRTRALFSEFVDAFGEASEVAMIDIFASAREAFDQSVSSDMLCKAIQEKFPNIPAKNEKTIQLLADYLRENTKPGDIVLTLGAGDIYQVHQLI